MKQGIDDQKKEYYAIIIYFLTMALNQIPFFWGRCERWIDIPPEKKNIYNRGNIVTWC
jgi:hypothetical protein